MKKPNTTTVNETNVRKMIAILETMDELESDIIWRMRNIEEELRELDSKEMSEEDRTRIKNQYLIKADTYMEFADLIRKNGNERYQKINEQT